MPRFGGGWIICIFHLFVIFNVISPNREAMMGGSVWCCRSVLPEHTHLSSKLSRLRRADKSGDKFVSICRKNCLHYCLHGAATFVQAGPIVSDVVSVHVADMTKKCGRQKRYKKDNCPPYPGERPKAKDYTSTVVAPLPAE